MKTITCIEDLRALARRRVPRAFFDYVDSGSYNEETLRANRADLEAIKLRQRVLVDVSERSLATTIIGQKVSGAVCAGADRAVRHAARRRRNPRPRRRRKRPVFRSRCRPCRSARSSRWRRRPSKPFWFQLYVIRDRGFSRDILARAAAAKCSALVLTVDLQVLGQRHRDITQRHDGAAGNPAARTSSTSPPSRAGP